MLQPNANTANALLTQRAHTGGSRGKENCSTRVAWHLAISELFVHQKLAAKVTSRLRNI
jgi:hypothetical protein